MLQDNVRGYISLKIKRTPGKHGMDKKSTGSYTGYYSPYDYQLGTGRRLPSIEYVYDMALLFGVGVEEFFPPIVIKTENDMEQELVSDFRKLNPEGKMIALASVKGFSHMAKFRNDLVK